MCGGYWRMRWHIHVAACLRVAASCINVLGGVTCGGISIHRITGQQEQTTLRFIVSSNTYGQLTWICCTQQIATGRDSACDSCDEF